MSHKFPYNYISCPCTGTSVQIDSSERSSRDLGFRKGASKLSALSNDEADEVEEKTFDPRSPRANYSLYPLEHLLYCEDCHQIRCPRCTIEEIICWYCPSCLFEVPSSMVKSEGNRCQRNCFNCPICTAPLSVNSLEAEDGGAQQGPYVLACTYCRWSSLEIGMQFEKPNNISGQLEKLKSGRASVTSPRATRTLEGDQTNAEGKAERRGPLSPDEQFSNLRSFYTSQMNDPSSNPLMTPSGDYSYSSPNALARIMSMYTNLGSHSKAPKAKPSPMREAHSPDEGMNLFDPRESAAAILKMKDLGWDGTTSAAQRSAQAVPATSKFTDDLKPVSTLLRTKRSKRCRTCRHILVKPEAKIQSTRFRIRLVALNYIPRLTLKPLQPSSSSSISTNFTFDALPPSKTIQTLLTLTNPLFDPVRITLATPTYTPGRLASKITILCPQFDVGANTDVWDDALNGSGSVSKHDSNSYSNSNSYRAKKTTTDTTDSGGGVGSPEKDKLQLQPQAEAGKPWSKGRNWTTVVVEITTPPNLDSRVKDGLEEDEDVLQIPMFVHVEYETDDAAGDEGGTALAGAGAGAGPGAGVGMLDKVGMGMGMGRKEKRELAFWNVLCVGRVV